MKKLLAFLLAAVLAACSCLLLASCGAQEKELILGFDAEFPPYGYLDTETNEYVGFDLELAAIVCKDLGYTLKLQPIDWDAKDADLRSGRIDCIWNGFTMNGRESKYAFTEPYIDSSIVVLVRSDGGIASLADLAGKKVSAQADSSAEAALKVGEDDDGETAAAKSARLASFAGGGYVTCADYVSGFTDLQTGAIDALVIDKGVAVSLIAGKTGFAILEEPLNSEQYAVGFLLGEDETAKEFTEALKRVDRETVFALADRYGIERGALLLWK